MDSKLRDEALLWIREVATILVEGTRKFDADAAQSMEQETTAYIRSLRQKTDEVIGGAKSRNPAE